MPTEPPTGTIAAQYLTDASGFTGFAERLIVPATEAEVVETLREAVKSATPVTISGAGSGLTGSRVPQGGWVISMERFRKLEIAPGFARVGPAISLLELRDASARTRSVLRARPHRDHRIDRWHHRHQRQRLAKLQVRQHPAPPPRTARGVDGRHRPRVPPRR